MGLHDKELVEIQNILYSYAVSLTHDTEMANDLLQETSLRILSHIDKYEEQGHFKAWAMTVMRRIFLNEAKKVSKNNETFVDGYDYSENEFSHPLVADCESILIGKELSNAIDKLPYRYSKMITMRIKGYKYEEIAKDMDISVGCVKSTIFVAKNSLKNILNN